MDDIVSRVLNVSFNDMGYAVLVDEGSKILAHKDRSKL